MRVRAMILAAVAMALAAPAASAAVPHQVAPGESLWSVAAADGLSVQQLAAANGLSSESHLVSGSTLMIPPQTGGVTAPASSAAGSGTSGSGAGSTTQTVSAPSGGAYVVQPGDTLSAIAQRAGMSISELAAVNGLDPRGLLLSGKILSLSGGGSVSPSGSSSESDTSPVSANESASSPAAGAETASSQPVGTAAQGSSGSPPYTTAESVAPSEVGQIAAANGVPSSLAEAIAYQESGFNNGLVSSADARGVMQILPGTWNWINSNLAGSMPLDPASAGSNIRAGVLLLRSLLNATGGNPALAAAGYYQGLPSVQQHGLYGDTQRYVNDVQALQRRFGGG